MAGITTLEPVNSAYLSTPQQSFLLGFRALLGGSWVVISGVISRVTIVITQIRGLITPLLTTHKPPSRVKHSGL